MKYFVCAVIGYLLGCFNTAYIVSKAKGFDIRTKGTGNAGASNIKLNLGWGYAVFTALTDIFKGFAAVWLARYLYPDNTVCQYLAGAMAVVGHIFPFFMGFRGGKGYAAYTGMMLGADWRIGVAVIIFGVIATLVINYIAVSTIITVILVLIYHVYIGAEIPVIIIVAALAVLIIWKHRTNIKKIINHEEVGLRDANGKL